VRAALLAASAPAGTDELYEVLRIEAGLPRFGVEIGEEYIPLEANLWDDVSFTKGCYIGQEIIARMESRGKQARVLAGLRLAAPLDADGERAVRIDGQPAGQVTSVAYSPALGPIALAFIKPALANPGAKATVGGVQALIAELPFEF
jgi:folate-binding protein YgfZ